MAFRAALDAHRGASHASESAPSGSAPGGNDSVVTGGDGGGDGTGCDGAGVGGGAARGGGGVAHGGAVPDVVHGTGRLAESVAGGLAEVVVYWMPVPEDYHRQDGVQEGTTAGVHEGMNAAADLLHDARTHGDVVVICSASGPAPPPAAPKASSAEAGAIDGGGGGDAGSGSGGPDGSGVGGVGAASRAPATGSAVASSRGRQPDGWARAVTFAYQVRWRGALPADALHRCGLRKGWLREACATYLPLLFSISLFETAPGAKSFAHYAAATVAFVADKLTQVGACLCYPALA